MVRYKGYGRVHLAVADVEKSRAFYSALGMQVREKRSNGGLMMALDGRAYDLDLSKYVPEALTTPRLLNQRVIRIALEVDTEDDLRSAWLAMEAAGFRPKGALDHGARRSVYLHDPDANTIEIYRELPDAQEAYRSQVAEGTHEFADAEARFYSYEH